MVIGYNGKNKLSLWRLFCFWLVEVSGSIVNPQLWCFEWVGGVLPWPIQGSRPVWGLEWKIKKVSIQMAKQGWEFALWFFVPITHFLWVKEQNSNLLFSKSKLLPSLLERLWVNRSCHSLKNSYGAKSVGGAIHSWAYKWEKQRKTVKKWWKQWILLSKLLIFWERKSNLL